MSKTKKEEIAEIRKIIEVAIIAIPKERDAHNFYLQAARKAPGEMSKNIFEDLANQEAQHEARLLAIIAMLEERLDTMG